MRVLVVNAGSSSLKLSVLDGSDLVSAQVLETSDGHADDEALLEIISTHGPFDGAGHRIVHGGTDFTKPVLVDDDVVHRLEALTTLAPLHQPKSLAALASVSHLLPSVPAVACFDTAFHATLPAAASTYAIPEAWRDRWGLRRFGFHGLSHSYAARRVGQLMDAGEASVPNVPGQPLRVVTCHLGAGASLAAVEGGICVDTTMGFTPLEGLVMATRSGTVDPGLVLWLAEQAGMSPAEISSGLEQHSGLLALAGTADMREVLAAESAGDSRAVLAMAVYLHRLCSCIGSMVVALGGLDGLVFTGGVGEKSAPVRSRVAGALAFLGSSIDETANQEAAPDCEVSGPGSGARTFVIAAREDLEIARGVHDVLQPSAPLA